jgi:hypothetical protein
MLISRCLGTTVVRIPPDTDFANFTWLPSWATSEKPAARSFLRASAKESGLSGMYVDLDRSDFWYKRRNRRSEMERQRFLKVIQSLSFRLALASDIHLEALSDIPTVLLPNAGRESFHGVIVHVIDWSAWGTRMPMHAIGLDIAGANPPLDQAPLRRPGMEALGDFCGCALCRRDRHASFSSPRFCADRHRSGFRFDGRILAAAPLHTR